MRRSDWGAWSQAGLAAGKSATVFVASVVVLGSFVLALAAGYAAGRSWLVLQVLSRQFRRGFRRGSRREATRA